MLDIYENIKKLREQHGMSQDELAELTGYTSRSSIAKIEKGLIDLQQSKIIAFANAFGITPEKLMGWDKESTVPTTYWDSSEYSEEELVEIKHFAEFIKSNRKAKPSLRHFTDVNDALAYLKKEISFVAAFDSDTTDPKIILEIANTIYMNQNNT